MRLYLAVAVLMLAFVAYTEAQDETIEDGFAKFGQHMADIGKTVAEKTKTTFDQFSTSDFVVTSKSWIQEQMEKLKASFQ